MRQLVELGEFGIAKGGTRGMQDARSEISERVFKDGQVESVFERQCRCLRFMVAIRQAPRKTLLLGKPRQA